MRAGLDGEARRRVAEVVRRPTTRLVACEHDAFLPSAKRFTDTLRSAGVDTAYRTEKSANHGHINDPSSVAAGKTIRTIRAWMQHRISCGVAPSRDNWQVARHLS